MTELNETIGQGVAHYIRKQTLEFVATERRGMQRYVSQASDRLMRYERTLEEAGAGDAITKIVDDALQAIAGINDLLKELEGE